MLNQTKLVMDASCIEITDRPPPCARDTCCHKYCMFSIPLMFIVIRSVWYLSGGWGTSILWYICRNDLCRTGKFWSCSEV